MLNVAIGVGSEGGAPRGSASHPDSKPADPAAPPNFAATAGLSRISPALRPPPFRRPSAVSPFPDDPSAVVPRRLPVLRSPAPFEREGAFPPTRLPRPLARALFFFLVSFMATWDKTLLFTPILCQLQLFFLEYLRLLASQC
jgi:hypothetical protein